MYILVTLFLAFMVNKHNTHPAIMHLNISDTIKYNDSQNENRTDESDVINLSWLGPNIYGLPNKESGAAAAAWSESSLVNPEELGHYAQGDILIPPELKRNGLKDVTHRWPKGHIPYVINEEQFNYKQWEMIMKAMTDFQRLTCLRFIPYCGQQDYIVIQGNNTGCWSAIGRIGGPQVINLQPPVCLTKKGTVIHELLHSVGFIHQHSSPERDDFVTILFNNISPGNESQFVKAETKDINNYGEPYDYHSVLHYSEYAFSKNEQKSIEPKVKGVKVGQRDGFSKSDVIKVNKMYGCCVTSPVLGWVDDIYYGIYN